jgi:hypothetical protein
MRGERPFNRALKQSFNQKKAVVPAKTGTHFSAFALAEGWVSTFVEMTI